MTILPLDQIRVIPPSERSVTTTPQEPMQWNDLLFHPACFEMISLIPLREMKLHPVPISSEWLFCQFRKTINQVEEKMGQAALESAYLGLRYFAQQPTDSADSRLLLYFMLLNTIARCQVKEFENAIVDFDQIFKLYPSQILRKWAIVFRTRCLFGVTPPALAEIKTSILTERSAAQDPSLKAENKLNLCFLNLAKGNTLDASYAYRSFCLLDPHHRLRPLLEKVFEDLPPHPSLTLSDDGMDLDLVPHQQALRPLLRTPLPFASVYAIPSAFLSINPPTFPTRELERLFTMAKTILELGQYNIVLNLIFNDDKSLPIQMVEAVALFFEGEYEEAKEAFDLLAEIKGYPTLRCWALALSCRSALASSFVKIEEAERICHRGLSLQMVDLFWHSEQWLNLAFIHAWKGEWLRAQHAFTEVLRIREIHPLTEPIVSFFDKALN